MWEGVCDVYGRAGALGCVREDMCGRMCVICGMCVMCMCGMCVMCMCGMWGRCDMCGMCWMRVMCMMSMCMTCGMCMCVCGMCVMYEMCGMCNLADYKECKGEAIIASGTDLLSVTITALDLIFYTSSKCLLYGNGFSSKN